MQELMTLSHIQKNPTEVTLESASMWASVERNPSVRIEGGEYTFATNEIRLKITMTPVLINWIRNYNHLEVEFRGKVYRVVDREEQQYYAILTCG